MSKEDDGFDEPATKQQEEKKGISTATWLVPTVATVTILGALGFTYYTIQERRKKELNKMRYGGYDDQTDLKSAFASTAENWGGKIFEFFGAVGGRARTYWYKWTGKQDYYGPIIGGHELSSTSTWDDEAF